MHQSIKLKKQRGFTLVELSIVLVIIGLIVGGVLVGQDLIAAAQIRSQVTQIQQLDTAMNTFRTQYGGLPGDARRGEDLGLQTANGNGNGIIDVTDDGTSAGTVWDGAAAPASGGDVYEVAQVFAALSNAEFVPGSYADGEFPVSKLEKGGMGVTSVGALNYWVVGLSIDVDGIPTGDEVVADGGALTGFQAWSIDTKIDDGRPQAGIMHAKQSGTAVWSDGGAAGTIAGFEGTLDATNCAADIDGDTIIDYVIATKGTAEGAVPDCPAFVRIQG